MRTETVERPAAPTRPSEGGLGARVGRKEDDRLLRGEGRYTDDLDSGRALHMAVGRCPFPHARIRSIDVTAARQLDGVADVLVGEQVRGRSAPIGVLRPVPGVPDLANFAMAAEIARYEGQPVVSVVAESRHLAEDAIDLIDVEYEPLPHVVDARAAIAPDAPTLHPGTDGNGLVTATLEHGQPERAFAEAAVAVAGRFAINRVSPLPMEGRAVLASWSPGRRLLEVQLSNQTPHMVRKQLAESLGIPEEEIRVATADAGGAFGQKLGLFPEELLACLHAMALRRPVKWTEDRNEHFRASTHARESLHDAALAATADGRLLAIRNSYLLDMGAFHSPFGPAVGTHQNLSGPYLVEHYRSERTVVTTNKTPIGAYRGYGQPEAVFVHERLVDRLARRLGADPLQLRLDNMIEPEQLPLTSPGGMLLDSGDYPRCLRMAAERVGWDERPRGRARLREDGRWVGYGLGAYVERTGYPHSRFLADRGSHYGAYEGVTLRATRSGGIEIHTGISTFGQGTETAMAQICSEEHGIDFARVKVLAGDTAVSPFSPGAFASRGLISGTGAVREAAAQLRSKTLRIAAHLLQVDDTALLEVAGDAVRRRDDPSVAVSLAEVHETAILGHRLPDDEVPGLESTVQVEPRGASYAYGSAAAVVSVDPATGAFDVERFVLVHDCGTPVNPMLIDGQVHGGLAQAFGAALSEELRYDPDSGQLVNGTMMDYFVPTAADLPEFELAHTEVPSQLTPYGIRGVGEAGTIPPAAAIANAICDALADFGVEIDRLPITPEQVWRALRDARGQGETER